MEWYFDQYFSDDKDKLAITQKASPLLQNFADTMPPTLVITAGCDPLRDEGCAYAKKLTEHDVNVLHHQFDGMIHAYMLISDLVTEEYQQTFNLIKEFTGK